MFTYKHTYTLPQSNRSYMCSTYATTHNYSLLYSHIHTYAYKKPTHPFTKQHTHTHTWTFTNTLIRNHAHTYMHIYRHPYIHTYRKLCAELHTQRCTTWLVAVFENTRVLITTFSYLPTHICKDRLERKLNFTPIRIHTSLHPLSLPYLQDHWQIYERL